MSSLLVTCQLVAAALIEDIALNAKGRQKLGGANCSSKRSLGTMCRRGRTDLGLTPTVLLFSTKSLLDACSPCCVGLPVLKEIRQFCLGRRDVIACVKPGE